MPETRLLVVWPGRGLAQPPFRNETARCRIDGPVGQEHRKVRLRLWLRDEIAELPCQLRVRVALRHDEIGVEDLGAVPNELERHLVCDQIDSARAPHGDHVDLAVADELLRLRAL